MLLKRMSRWVLDITDMEATKTRDLNYSGPHTANVSLTGMRRTKHRDISYRYSDK